MNLVAFSLLFYRVGFLFNDQIQEKKREKMEKQIEEDVLC